MWKLFSITMFVASFAYIILAQTPGETCLGCICEASTGCNVSTACHVPYAGAYFCGPFLISWSYWSDADKPVLEGDDPNANGAFERCALDTQCAASIIRSYMNKFGQQDCNGDDKIDCDDYVRIHILGGFECNSTSFEEREVSTRYRNCMKVVKAASLPSHQPLNRAIEVADDVDLGTMQTDDAVSEPIEVEDVVE